MLEKVTPTIIYSSAVGMTAVNYQQLIDSADTWTVEQWASVGVVIIALLTFLVNTLFKFLSYLSYLKNK